MQLVTYSEFKENLGYLFLVALFIKLMVFGLSIAECLGALVLLSFAFGSLVLDYYVPKRPDLYTDLKSLQVTNEGLVSKVEELERDVMAIKMRAR
jgi:hypothetical protein